MSLYQFVLEEFIIAQRSKGYQRPLALSDIERCPSDDEVPDTVEESRCRVDIFFKKGRGLR